MKFDFLKHIKKKIIVKSDFHHQLALWRFEQEKIVFTNGCFDILHAGHLQYLAQARSLGTKLVIGLNSDASVKRLKGNHRPINDDMTRTMMLASLEVVDAVIIFEEDTPFDLIDFIRPSILVKGGDYKIDDIIGADIVMKNGGEVKTLLFLEGYSTTNIESKIRKS